MGRVGSGKRRVTHDELLAEIDSKIEYCTCEGWGNNCWGKENIPWQALRAVVELHKPESNRMPFCVACRGVWQGEIDVVLYPCDTIQAIEKEL